MAAQSGANQHDATDDMRHSLRTAAAWQRYVHAVSSGLCAASVEQLRNANSAFRAAGDTAQAEVAHHAMMRRALFAAHSGAAARVDEVARDASRTLPAGTFACGVPLAAVSQQQHTDHQALVEVVRVAARRAMQPGNKDSLF